MSINDFAFLRYSAQTPMKELRRRFNQGQTLEQPAPEFSSQKEVLEDVVYVLGLRQRVGEIS